MPKKDNFNESVKMAKEYLSWNSYADYETDFEDYINDTSDSYSEIISEEFGIRTYSFIWNLPFFDSFFLFHEGRSIAKEDFTYSDESNLESWVEQYENMLIYSEALFNPQKDLYDYFPFDIKMKFGKKEPEWYSALYSNFNYDFSDQKIEFKRDKNIITFDWQMPDDFKSIEFFNEQELFDRYKYSTS